MQTRDIEITERERKSESRRFYWRIFKTNKKEPSFSQRFICLFVERECVNGKYVETGYMYKLCTFTCIAFEMLAFS